MSVVIGLSGKKRVGKDHAAQILVKEFGFHRLAFADALKDIALEVDPYVYVGDYFSDRLSDVLWGWGDRKGPPNWDSAKDNWKVRELLQNLGSAIRKSDPDFFTRIVEREALQFLEREIPVVISDVRYENELELIHSLGGMAVRIERPSLSDFDTHPSETALDDREWFLQITNDGTDRFDEAVRAAGRLALREYQGVLF